MKWKIWAVSMLAIFMLIAISFSTSVSSNIINSIEKKESPLYQIRTRQAISDRIVEIVEEIKTRFLGERIYFLNFRPIRRLFNLEDLPVNYRDIPCTKWCEYTSYTQC